MNKELILKLMMAELINQSKTSYRPYVDFDDDKQEDVILDGHFNLDKIAEIIMKEFENE